MAARSFLYAVIDIFRHHGLDFVADAQFENLRRTSGRGGNFRIRSLRSQRERHEQQQPQASRLLKRRNAMPGR